MATTQFAMVEELASLIKDNLHSKHLILSTEEALIAALQQLRCADDVDGDSDGGEEDAAADTIELQPAGAYHRLLLHRLAEIYGYCCLLAQSGVVS
ncbi:R3H domain-containing protein 1-like [Panicum miliaceum]|uniref:R3H domain-containing protein 1-like n=1 Tax=Panicum miliaceum TaxID=4540 RepID=A0A3L6TT65_PANMI|nr:R3H domain-containing protein 1-like [Panicum miliaceum]